MKHHEIQYYRIAFFFLFLFFSFPQQERKRKNKTGNCLSLHMIIVNLNRAIYLPLEDLPAPEPRDIFMLGSMQGSDFVLLWC
jgi:hypothetical protein